MVGSEFRELRIEARLKACTTDRRAAREGLQKDPLPGVPSCARRACARDATHQNSFRNWKVPTASSHAMTSCAPTMIPVSFHPITFFCSATVARHGV